MTTRYLDLENGNDANNGSSFALRKKTLASATAGLTGNDTVLVMASPDPTSMGQDATFTNGSDTVTLTTAVTANISTCETAWTPSANVTSTAQTTYVREGTNAARNDIGSSFTTGLVAYTSFAAMDLSAYQQISFLFYSGQAIAANVLQLKLCSDAAGVTAVNTVNLPAIAAGQWTAVCVDTGGALGSSIQSVALYAASDPGVANTVIDNIIACKAPSAADSLTHYSLISKNTGTEPWMAIDTINGTTIKLAGGYQNQNARSGWVPNYYGTTATQTIYKREPIALTAQQAMNANGSSMDSPLNIECGWDRTAMASQSGHTFCRLINPNPTGSHLFDGSTYMFTYLNRWFSVNCVNAGVSMNQNWRLGEVGAIACSMGFRISQSASLDAFSQVTRYAIHCLNAVKVFNAAGGPPPDSRLRFKYMWGTRSNSSSYVAVDDSGSGGFGRCLVVDCDIQGHFAVCGNSTASIGNFNEFVFQNCVAKNLDRLSYSGAPRVFFVNCTLTYSNSGIANSQMQHFVNQGGDTTDHKIAFGFYVGGSSNSIVSDTSTRHTASDFSWKFVLTQAVYSYGPMFMSVAKIACVANEQRTVKLWFRRSSAANLSMRLRVKGGLVQGIPDDIVTNMTAAANTWEQLTIQFTPTQQCVVEVFAELWGTNTPTNGWVDDLEVS